MGLEREGSGISGILFVHSAYGQVICLSNTESSSNLSSLTQRYWSAHRTTAVKGCWVRCSMFRDFSIFSYKVLTFGQSHKACTNNYFTSCFMTSRLHSQLRMEPFFYDTKRWFPDFSLKQTHWLVEVDISHSLRSWWLLFFSRAGRLLHWKGLCQKANNVSWKLCHCSIDSHSM